VTGEIHSLDFIETAGGGILKVRKEIGRSHATVTMRPDSSIST